MQRLTTPLLVLASGSQWRQPVAHAEFPAAPAPGTCGIGEDHHADGWGNVNIACPPGETVAEVTFASWGDWTVECDGGIKCEAKKDDCSGAGCNGGTSCACPCKGFVSTDVCPSCSWSKGECSGVSAQDFVEKSCLGKAKCGPFPANNGNEYDGAGKGDPCPGKPKHLGIAVRCCPPSGCPVMSEWGPQFLLFAFLVAGAYFGGGGAYRFHKLGSRGSDLLPHQAFWREIRGLVEDGVIFARAGGKQRRRSSSKGGAYTAVPDAAAAEKTSGRRSTRKDQERDRDSKAARGKKKSAKKREKKDGGEKLDKIGSVERGLAPAPAPTPGPAPPAGGVAASTASGGGGRWVHVPN